MDFTNKVRKFLTCIDATKTLQDARRLAVKKYGLYAADVDGGSTSDRAAWEEAQRLIKE